MGMVNVGALVLVLAILAGLAVLLVVGLFRVRLTGHSPLAARPGNAKWTWADARPVGPMHASLGGYGARSAS